MNLRTLKRRTAARVLYRARIWTRDGWDVFYSDRWTHAVTRRDRPGAH
jgi:hypothetical protein